MMVREFRFLTCRRSVVSTAAALAYYVMFRYVMPIQFEVNDDIFMMLLASGHYTGEPSSYLVFINYAVAASLKSFYEVFPGGEWYPSLFLAVHAAAIAISVYISIDNEGIRSPESMVRLLLLMSMILVCTIMLQFTTTAALGASAGIWLMIRYPDSRSRLLGALLFLLGASIRFHAAMLVVAVSLPLMIAWGVEHWRSVKDWLAVPAVIAAAFLLQGISDEVYRTQDPFYHAYNEMRGRINGIANVTVPVGDLPKSVTANDYALLRGFFSDPASIDPDDYQRLVDASESRRVVTPAALTTTFVNITSRMDVLAIMIILSLAAYQSNKQLQSVAYACAGLVFIALICYLDLMESLKDRVFLAGLLSLTMAMAAMGSQCRSKTGSRVTIVVVVLATIMFIGIAAHRVQSTRERHHVLMSQLETVERWPGDVVVRADNLMVNGAFLFTDEAARLGRRLYYSGWLAGHPDNRKYASHARLLHDDVAVLVRMEEVEDAATQIATSISETYGIQAGWKMQTSGTGVSLLRFYEFESNRSR